LEGEIERQKPGEAKEELPGTGRKESRKAYGPFDQAMETFVLLRSLWMK